MFFRLLGKLFFYLWILPFLSNALKGITIASLKKIVAEEREIQRKQKNADTESAKDPMDHPPLS